MMTSTSFASIVVMPLVGSLLLLHEDSFYMHVRQSSNTKAIYWLATKLLEECRYDCSWQETLIGSSIDLFEDGKVNKTLGGTTYPVV